MFSDNCANAYFHTTMSQSIETLMETMERLRESTRSKFSQASASQASQKPAQKQEEAPKTTISLKPLSGSQPIEEDLDLDAVEDENNIQKLDELKKSQVETQKTIDQLLEHTNSYLVKLSNAVIFLKRDIEQLKKDFGVSQQ